MAPRTPVADPFAQAFPPQILHRPVILASSGGGDSLAALVVLHRWWQQGRIPALAVVSIDHQLQPDSAEWSAMACAQASSLGVSAMIKTVTVPTVDRFGHRSVEARARQARYDALAEVLAAQPGSVLVTAHHQQDQAETVLLALLRGSGTAGLSAMPACAPFAGSWHWRPFLGVPLAQMRAVTVDFRVAPVADPSNQDTAFDRNYVRQEIFPRLKARWPRVVTTLADAAEGAAADRQVLQEFAQHLVPDLTSGVLPLQRLNGLSRAAQANSVRAWVRAQGALMPPRARLMEFLRQIQTARTDRQPVLRWGPWGIQRDRASLHWVPKGGANPPLEVPIAWPNPRLPLLWPDGQRWRLIEAAAGGAEVIAAEWLNQPWRVRAWRAEDRLRLREGAPRRRVKELFQVQGVPVWQRRQFQLIEMAGQPAWIPGLALDVRFRAPAASSGWMLVRETVGAE